MNDVTVHPLGAARKRPESDCRALVPAEGSVALDTFGGRVHVEWDPSAAVSPLGQLPFFTEFLKVSGLCEPWVEQCPVTWTSPNAPNRRDALGTAALSLLCGHTSAAPTSAPCAATPSTRRCSASYGFLIQGAWRLDAKPASHAASSVYGVQNARPGLPRTPTLRTHCAHIVNYLTFLESSRAPLRFL